jgi:hypothetical protein
MYGSKSVTTPFGVISRPCARRVNIFEIRLSRVKNAVLLLVVSPTETFVIVAVCHEEERRDTFAHAHDARLYVSQGFRLSEKVQTYFYDCRLLQKRGVFQQKRNMIPSQTSVLYLLASCWTTVIQVQALGLSS